MTRTNLRTKKISQTDYQIANNIYLKAWKRSGLLALIFFILPFFIINDIFFAFVVGLFFSTSLFLISMIIQTVFLWSKIYVLFLHSSPRPYNTYQDQQEDSSRRYNTIEYIQDWYLDPTDPASPLNSANPNNPGCPYSIGRE